MRMYSRSRYQNNPLIEYFCTNIGVSETKDLSETMEKKPSETHSEGVKKVPLWSVECSFSNISVLGCCAPTQLLSLDLFCHPNTKRSRRLAPMLTRTACLVSRRTQSRSVQRQRSMKLDKASETNTIVVSSQLNGQKLSAKARFSNPSFTPTKPHTNPLDSL